MAQRYPELLPLFELRSTTAKLRLVGLTIGADGRNRCLLSPFGSKTSRNLPSNSKFIFGSSRWMRGLIRAPADCVLAYIDWSGQEFAIAAALSNDPTMLADYRSGDPHLTFAKRHHLAPEGATADTHPAIRDMCKTMNLGTLYGLTEVGLALRIGVLPVKARQLLRFHRDTYWKYWSWVERTVHSAMMNGYLTSTFGWHYHIPDDVNLRSLQNWPMQTNAAEMMRVAAIAATESGLEVCCPVHDAFLLCAPIERAAEDIAAMREIMHRASMLVTGGVKIHTDVKRMMPGERYMDKRGKAMWGRANRLLENVRGSIEFPQLKVA
jgi:DNA polymerase I-like protein with 3'-5' exonuclease and polymerase domains